MHTDPHQSVAYHIGSVTIGVEGHAPKIRMGGCCAEIRRGSVATPPVAMLETTISVTRNEEAREERIIANQQLIGVSIVNSHTDPQSICVPSIQPSTRGCYRRLVISFEVLLVSSLVVNEDDFCELKREQKRNEIVGPGVNLIKHLQV